MTKHLSRGNDTELLQRTAVTVAVAAVLVALHYIVLPSLEWRGLGVSLEWFMHLEDPFRLSLGMLGVAPVVSAFITVEFFALIIKPLRHLRAGSRSGRRKLVRAAQVLSLILAGAQALGIASALDVTEFGPPVDYPLVVMWLSLGTVSVLLLARIVERGGLGGGLQIAVAVDLGFPLLSRAFQFDSSTYVQQQVSIVAVSVLALLLLYWPAKWVAWFAELNPLPKQRREKGEATPLVPAILPWLLAGMVPIYYVGSGLQLPQTLLALSDAGGNAEAFLEQWSLFPWWVVLVALASAYAFATGFYSINKLRKVDGRLGLPLHGLADEQSRFRIARRTTIGFHMALAIVYVWLTTEGVYVDVLTPMILVAVALDLRGEWRFRRAHRQVVDVYGCNYVYEALRICDALGERRVPVQLCGLQHRTLLHFYAPFVPISFLVPVQHREQAEAVIQLYLANDTGEKE